ncbi:hypothetical protein [Photorhabdus viridis]|uniref:hypothetical protein n=1 Tax=Photorhabdus viridis TaxID=3163327 RepID=UPI0033073723
MSSLLMEACVNPLHQRLRPEKWEASPFFTAGSSHINVLQFNSRRLFVEVAYDDVHSDNPAYENKKQTILETGVRLYF